MLVRKKYLYLLVLRNIYFFFIVLPDAVYSVGGRLEFNYARLIQN